MVVGAAQPDTCDFAEGELDIGAAWLVVPVVVVYITLFPLYWEYGEVNYTGEGRTYNTTYFAFSATVVLAAGVSSTWPRSDGPW